MDSLQEFVRQQDPDDRLEVTDEIPLEYVCSGTALELERRRKYPVVTFRNVEGFDMPVVTNVLATRERISRAIGIDPETDNFHETWNERIENRVPVTATRDGPIHDNVFVDDEVNVNEQLPVPRHFEDDGGRYITAGVLLAEHPETGVPNLSFARTQLKEPRKLGISVHSRGDIYEYLRVAENRGEPLDVALVIGAHPSFYVGTAPTPPINVSELELIGALREEPVSVSPAQTVDIEVPSEAEVVIEGTIDPTELEDEGPFGEYTGFMSGRSTRNVVQVSSITHRDDPLFYSIVAGRSAEHINLSGMPKEPEIYQQVKDEVPTVRDVTIPKSGTLLMCFVSIEKTSPGQPTQAMLSAMGARRNLKIVVVVDEEVDIHDEREVIWAMATRVQADRDVQILPNSFGGLLDPSSDEDGVTQKMGIDATIPLDQLEEFDQCSIPIEQYEHINSILEAHDIGIEERTGHLRHEFEATTRGQESDDEAPSGM